MVIYHMNKKGFLLVDALISVLIVMALVNLILNLYQILNRQNIIYENYNQRINDNLDILYASYEGCICEIEDE